MKKTGLIIYFIFFCSRLLYPQDQAALFGYYESQLMGAELHHDVYQLYTNKLRVDLEADLARNVYFAANFDYITYHGKTEWNILDFLAPSIRDSIPTELHPIYTIPFRNRQFLDNAYLKIVFRHFDLTAGKQQISLGTGYVWNPIDIFNVKDVLDPTYEQPGHNALRLDFPIGMRSSLTAIYAPQDTWDQSAKVLRLKSGISRFDFTLIAIDKQRIIHDYTQFDMQQQRFAKSQERRQLFGASTVGELLGLGVYAEYAYNQLFKSDDYYELVLGTNYTFDFQTYVMLEYYQSMLGKSNFHNYTINEWMRQYAQEQKTIAREQVYFLIQHPITDFVQCGLTGIHCLSDNSFALVPMLQYSFSQDTEIIMYINANFGQTGTLYARDTGSGGMLRARVYF